MWLFVKSGGKDRRPLGEITKLEQVFFLKPGDMLQPINLERRLNLSTAIQEYAFPAIGGTVAVEICCHIFGRSLMAVSGVDLFKKKTKSCGARYPRPRMTNSIVQPFGSTRLAIFLLIFWIMACQESGSKEQDDGNLVMYDDRFRPVWTSGTHAYFGGEKYRTADWKPVKLVIDSNLLVLYSATARWVRRGQTGVERRHAPTDGRRHRPGHPPR